MDVAAKTQKLQQRTIKAQSVLQVPLLHNLQPLQQKRKNCSNAQLIHIGSCSGIAARPIVLAAKIAKLLQQPPNLYHPCFYACSKNHRIAANPYNLAAAPLAFTTGQATFMWLKVWYCCKTTHFCSNFLVFAAKPLKYQQQPPLLQQIPRFCSRTRTRG